MAHAETRKKEFHKHIDAIIPWYEWMEIIRPYHYKCDIENKPFESRFATGCNASQIKLVIHKKSRAMTEFRVDGAHTK